MTSTIKLDFEAGTCEVVESTEKLSSGSLHPDCSAAGVKEEKAALRTYRRIWKRLPKHVRDEQMGMMKCWSPLDYETMVAEEKRQNDPDQRPAK